MSDEEQRKLGLAASDLCIAAADFEDAVQEVTRLGRIMRGTDAARGMPSDHQCDSSRSVVAAYRETESRFEAAEERLIRLWMEILGD